jgi:DNA sulfur modification protein DndD
MIFDAISLQNVGVFQGDHEIELTPPNKNKPVVLIGGLNGCGKTTILESLLLVLYGKLSPAVRQANVSYDSYFRRLVNRNVRPAEGAAVELTFRSAMGGAEHTYRIARSWTFSGKRLRERFDVYVDGMADSVLSDHWYDSVDRFLPVQLAGLFFFDGERIEELADPRRAPELLSSAISALFGVDLIERLGLDLDILRRRKEKERPDCPEAEKLAFLDERLQAIIERRRAAKQIQAKTQTDVDRNEHDIQTLEEEFRVQGGELAQARAANEQHLEDVTLSIVEVEEELLSLAAGPLPLLMIPRWLESVVKQTQGEAAAASDAALLAALEERDQWIVAQLQSVQMSPNDIALVDQILEEDRLKRTNAKCPDMRLGLQPETIVRIQDLLKTHLRELRVQVERLLEKHAGLDNQRDDLERRISSAPDEDSLATLIENLENARARMADLRSTQLRQSAELDEIQREETRIRDERESVRRKMLASDNANSDLNRFIKHATTAQDTLGRFRTLLIEQHVHRLERDILECYSQLLRKKGLIGGMRIDSESCALTLLDAHDREIPTERLSAGERQLLATSILWGLARASGRVLPIVIDTPLGRLDSVHRKHLVERYFPCASHQVVLLSTDEEIDEEFCEDLRRHIGHAYILEHDDALARTKVETGYFWEGARSAR